MTRAEREQRCIAAASKLKLELRARDLRGRRLYEIRQDQASLYFGPKLDEVERMLWVRRTA
jgi:hypothetical protein